VAVARPDALSESALRKHPQRGEIVEFLPSDRAINSRLDEKLMRSYLIQRGDDAETATWYARSVVSEEDRKRFDAELRNARSSRGDVNLINVQRVPSSTSPQAVRHRIDGRGNKYYLIVSGDASDWFHVSAVSDDHRRYFDHHLRVLRRGRRRSRLGGGV